MSSFMTFKQQDILQQYWGGRRSKQDEIIIGSPRSRGRDFKVSTFFESSIAPTLADYICMPYYICQRAELPHLRINWIMFVKS
jgi:hypothetical protein